jgi:hypothetical protein
MNASLAGVGVEWSWSGGWRGRRVTPTLLHRGAAISTALAGIAEAARQRIAEIEDPDASAPTDN